jgi:hypothetical protein
MKVIRAFRVIWVLGIFRDFYSQAARREIVASLTQKKQTYITHFTPYNTPCITTRYYPHISLYMAPQHHPKFALAYL